MDVTHIVRLYRVFIIHFRFISELIHIVIESGNGKVSLAIE